MWQFDGCKCKYCIWLWQHQQQFKREREKRLIKNKMKKKRLNHLNTNSIQYTWGAILCMNWKYVRTEKSREKYGICISIRFFPLCISERSMISLFSLSHLNITEFANHLLTHTFAIEKIKVFYQLARYYALQFQWFFFCLSLVLWQINQQFRVWWVWYGNMGGTNARVKWPFFPVSNFHYPMTLWVVDESVKRERAKEK